MRSKVLKVLFSISVFQLCYSQVQLQLETSTFLKSPACPYRTCLFIDRYQATCLISLERQYSLGADMYGLAIIIVRQSEAEDQEKLNVWLI
jgi:hypothetical protein